MGLAQVNKTDMLAQTKVLLKTCMSYNKGAFDLIERQMHMKVIHILPLVMLGPTSVSGNCTIID